MARLRRGACASELDDYDIEVCLRSPISRIDGEKVYFNHPAYGLLFIYLRNLEPIVKCCY